MCQPRLASFFGMRLRPYILNSKLFSVYAQNHRSEVTLYTYAHLDGLLTKPRRARNDGGDEAQSQIPPFYPDDRVVWRRMFYGLSRFFLFLHVFSFK